MINEYGIDPMAIKQAAYDAMNIVAEGGSHFLHDTCRIQSYNYPDIIGDWMMGDVLILRSQGRPDHAYALESVFAQYVAPELSRWGVERLQPFMSRENAIA